MAAHEQQKAGGYMFVNLKSYLDELRAAEQGKPVGQRRDVPTLTDLAQVAGIHKVSMSRLVQGQVRSLNLDLATKIMDELWRRGFRPDPNDLLVYRPPESEE